jgi:hypothetical protein
MAENTVTIIGWVTLIIFLVAQALLLTALYRINPALALFLIGFIILILIVVSISLIAVPTTFTVKILTGRGSGILGGRNDDDNEEEIVVGVATITES